MVGIARYADRFEFLRLGRNRFCTCAIASASLLSVAWPTFAQDMEPRAYSKTPVGMNFAVAGYAYSEGGLATDPAVPLEDAHLEIHAALVAYARSFGLFGKSCKADVVLPYILLSGDALFNGQPRSREAEG